MSTLRHILILVSILTLSLSSNAQTAWKADHLKTIFSNPPQEYHPFVRWWWNGNKVDSAEICRELELLHEAKIGGVEINPVCFPPFADSLGKKSLEWLSDEWIDMIGVACRKAKSLGMTVDLIVGSGWPYGGEWLPMEQRAQVILVYCQKVNGPQKMTIHLDSIAKAVDPMVTVPNPDRTYEIVALQLVPDPITSLKETISFPIADDTIDIPSGSYCIYALVKYSSFASVIEGAPGASGPILDHMNANAVDGYLYNMCRRIEQRIGPLKNHVRAMFTDSMELEGCNWNKDFEEQFLKEYGYSIMHYLPFLLYKVGRLGEVTDYHYGASKSEAFQKELESIRYDYESFKARLLKENFTQRFALWCEHLGVKSRAQAYGRGFDPFSTSLLMDIPECESWTTNYLRHRPGYEMPDDNTQRGRTYTMINKYVSSASYFKNLDHPGSSREVSCEEMTNTYNVFNASLEDLKMGSDMSLQSGVTHSVWHGFNYSPNNEVAFPGWITYGNYLSENNSWWPYFHLLNEYKARLSAVMMNTDPYADIAILVPTRDLWSLYGVQTEPFPNKTQPSYLPLLWEAINKCGGAAVYADEERLVQHLDHFKAVILPCVERIDTLTAEALKNYTGTLLFLDRRPTLCNEHTNGTLVNTPDNLDFINWYSKLQDSLSLPRQLTITTPNPYVMQTQRTDDHGRLFVFFTNSNRSESECIRFELDQHIQEKVTSLWDAESGVIRAFDFRNGSFYLAPSQSLLLCFENDSITDKLPDFKKFVLFSQSIHDLSHNWEVTLGNRHLCMDTLKPLPNDFGGTAIYRNQLPKGNNFDLLTLEHVEGICEVWVNGKPVGTKWYGDRTFNIKPYLHRIGKNSLEVRITTTLGNSLQSMTDNPAVMKWFTGRKQQPFYPQGILGPVVLQKTTPLN